MQIQLDADTEIARFARTHIEFAVWHPWYDLGGLEVHLVEDAPGVVYCAMRASCAALGEISSGAVAGDRFDAVTRAARLLESAVREVARQHDTREPMPRSLRSPRRPAELARSRSRATAMMG